MSFKCGITELGLAIVRLHKTVNSHLLSIHSFNHSTYIYKNWWFAQWLRLKWKCSFLTLYNAVQSHSLYTINFHYYLAYSFEKKVLLNLIISAHSICTLLPLQKVVSGHICLWHIYYWTCTLMEDSHCCSLMESFCVGVLSRSYKLITNYNHHHHTKFKYRSI